MTARFTALSVTLILSMSLLNSCASNGTKDSPGDPTRDFTGTWMTDDTAVRKGGFHGTIILDQKGDEVFGLFADHQWSLRGDVSGRILTGKWWWNSTGDTAFEETMAQFRGELEWTLSEDGKTFTGWGKFEDGRQIVWTGRRID